MTDEELIARLFDGADDWPQKPLRLTPPVQVTDPIRWRASLRGYWSSGRADIRALVLGDMRSLAVAAFVPVVVADDPGAAAGDACWRASREAEERRGRAAD